MIQPDAVEFDGMKLKYEINFPTNSVGWGIKEKLEQVTSNKV